MLTSRRGEDVLELEEELKELMISREAQGTTKEFLMGSNQCVRSELGKEVASNLSKSVVSLAFSNGHTVLFVCLDIGVEHVEYVTRFLTTVSLDRALIHKRKDHDNSKVEVCHRGNVVTGFLGEYDLDHNIAVVKVISLLNVHVVPLIDLVELLPNNKVVALRHDISGKLMATCGVLTDDLSRSDELKLSACKISKN